MISEGLTLIPKSRPNYAAANVTDTFYTADKPFHGNGFNEEAASVSCIRFRRLAEIWSFFELCSENRP